jgi:hypothetical protein
MQPITVGKNSDWDFVVTKKPRLIFERKEVLVQEDFIVSKNGDKYEIASCRFMKNPGEKK